MHLQNLRHEINLPNNDLIESQIRILKRSQKETLTSMKKYLSDISVSSLQLKEHYENTPQERLDVYELDHQWLESSFKIFKQAHKNYELGQAQMKMHDFLTNK